MQNLWSIEERQRHINLKELRAARLAVEHFSKICDWRNIRIRILVDNTVTVAYLSKLGGKVPYLNDELIQLYQFCQARNLSIEAGYIRGLDNIIADRLSRQMPTKYSDWSLTQECFQEIDQIWGPVTVDLFASRTNRKVKRYVSLKREWDAEAIDAFSICWRAQGELPYANPPFVLMPRILRKLTQEKAKIILVAPVWTTAVWWPTLISLTIAQPMLISDNQIVITQKAARKIPTWTTAVLLL